MKSANSCDWFISTNKKDVFNNLKASLKSEPLSVNYNYCERENAIVVLIYGGLNNDGAFMIFLDFQQYLTLLFFTSTELKQENREIQCKK